MPIHGDPERIVQEVLEKAKKEADSLVKRSLKLKEKRLMIAKEEALKPQAEAEARAKLQAARIKRRILSSTQLEAKRMILSKKEELVVNVFSQAFQKVQQLRKSKSYPDIIFGLIEEAATELGDKKLTVEFDKEDAQIFTQKFQADISNKLSCQLYFKEKDIPGGGVVLTSSHTVFDNSFSARLQRLQTQVREEVLEILLS